MWIQAAKDRRSSCLNSSSPEDPTDLSSGDEKEVTAGLLIAAVAAGSVMVAVAEGGVRAEEG